MSGASGHFIHDLALVLGVAAVTGVLSRRLRQPSVLGYLAAGLIVGPHTPVPLFADPGRVHVMSEFGVILVMFGVGLELRLKTLVKVIPTVGLVGLIQLSALFWVGVSLGRLFGWGTVEALFLGASLAISSTMVVSKVFQEAKPQADLRSFVLGILILQDLAAIVLIAVMTAVARGTGLSGQAIGFTVLRLAAVLAGMVGVGWLVVPGFVRRVVRMKSPETRVVVAVGICFVFALAAEELGYSVALGAFLAGLLVAESGRAHDVEHDLVPLKDVFGAVFFVSVGMTVDPAQVWANLGPSLLVFLAVVLTQFVAVSLGGVLSGAGLRRSLHAGLALGQIGEFAFIIAGVGAAAGVVQPSLQPILVTVAVLTTFTTPVMVRHAPTIVSRVDHLLPSRLQSWLVLYEALFERLRNRPAGRRGLLRGAAGALALDTAGLVALLVGWRLLGPKVDGYLHAAWGWSEPAAAALTTAVPLLLGLPLVVGVVRSAQRLSLVTTELLFGDARGPWAVAGARAWKIALATLTVLSLGVPGAALVRPVLPFPFVLGAVAAAAALPDLAHCADLSALAAEVDAPDDPATQASLQDFHAALAEARAQAAAGHYTEGLASVETASAALEGSAYAPAVSELRVVRGNLLAQLSRNHEAQVALTSAFLTAQRARHQPVAAEASRDLVALVGVELGQHELGLTWADIAEATLGQHAPRPRDEAALLGARARVLSAAGRREEAMTEAHRALALLEGSPEAGPYELGQAGFYLGLTQNDIRDYVAARVTLAEAVGRLEAALGPEHPELVEPLAEWGRALYGVDEFDLARAVLDRAVSLARRLGGPKDLRLGMALSRRAAMHTQVNEHEAALADFREARTIFEAAYGSKHTMVARLWLNMGACYQRQGRLQEAMDHYQAALRLREALLGPHHPDLAVILQNMGTLLVEAGRSAEAIELLRRSVALRYENLSAPGAEADPEFWLGRALYESGRDKKEGAALVRKAYDTFSRLGVYRAIHPKEWLEAHRLLKASPSPPPAPSPAGR
ncbi:MAG: cation:proton antiporter [Myxococcales bacterium]|nr:cation:proton antiporter [Myxococcales bacterium]